MSLLLTTAVMMTAPVVGYAEPNNPPDISWDPAAPPMNENQTGEVVPAPGVGGNTKPSDATRQVDSSGDVSTVGTQNPGVSPAAGGSSMMPSEDAQEKASAQSSTTSSTQQSDTNDAGQPVNPVAERLVDFGLLPADATADQHMPMVIYMGAGVLIAIMVLGAGTGMYLLVKRRRTSNQQGMHNSHTPDHDPFDGGRFAPVYDETTPHKPAHFAPKDARSIKSQLMRDMGMSADLGLLLQEGCVPADRVGGEDAFERQTTNRLRRLSVAQDTHKPFGSECSQAVGEGILSDANLMYQPDEDAAVSEEELGGSHFMKRTQADTSYTMLEDTDAYLARCGIALRLPSTAKAYETFVSRDAFDYDPPFEAHQGTWRPVRIASIEQMEADAHRDQEIKEQVAHTYHEVAAEIEALARRAKRLQRPAQTSKSKAPIPHDASEQSSLDLDLKIAEQATHFTEQPKGFDLHKMFSDEFVEPVHQAESPILRVAQLAIVPETEVPSVEEPAQVSALRSQSMAIGNTDMFLRAVLEAEQEAQVRKDSDAAAIKSVKSPAVQGVAGAWSVPSGPAVPPVAAKSAYSPEFDYISTPGGQESPHDSLLFFGQDVVRTDERGNHLRPQLREVLRKGAVPGDNVVDRFRFYWAQVQ